MSVTLRLCLRAPQFYPDLSRSAGSVLGFWCNVKVYLFRKGRTETVPLLRLSKWNLLPEIVDRQISIISKIPFRNRYLDIQLRFSYIPLIQKPRLYLPILSYHRLI